MILITILLAVLGIALIVLGDEYEKVFFDIAGVFCLIACVLSIVAISAC